MDMRRQRSSVNFMYANAPFTANTKYRAKVTGTYAGGMLTKEWTFTTGAASRRFSPNRSQPAQAAFHGANRRLARSRPVW